jgi:hypothetical protein
MGGILTGLIGSYAPVSGNYESIQTVTVGAGGVSSIDFTSIPSTYKHLQIRGIVKPTVASNLIIKYNNDAANHYAHFMYGDGASTAGGQSGSGYIGYASSTAQFSGFVIDLYDYTSTAKNKTGRAYMGTDANGSGYPFMSSHMYYPSTITAISSINMSIQGSNLAQYSSFALYGIK